MRKNGKAPTKLRDKVTLLAKSPSIDTLPSSQPTTLVDTWRPVFVCE